MDIGNLDFSEAAWLSLGKLAMAVELKCGKRFAFRKAIDEIVGLLETAEASVDTEIRRRKEEFLQVISPSMQRLLSGRGLLVGPGDVAVGGDGGQAGGYYRGAKVVNADQPASSVPAKSETPVDEQGRKRIVYRGKVTYI